MSNWTKRVWDFMNKDIEARTPTTRIPQPVRIVDEDVRRERDALKTERNELQDCVEDLTEVAERKITEPVAPSDLTSRVLPSWASLQKGDHPVQRIDVDAAVMYPTLIGDYREFYANSRNRPVDWKDSEWSECLAELQNQKPSAYWLEVVYQSMKLDLQVAMGQPQIEIRVHDSGKKWAQKTAVQGRSALCAAGAEVDGDGKVVRRRLEAREHYKRMRGFFPA